MKNLKLSNLLLLVIIPLLFVSCEEEEYITPSDMATEQGKITVTLNGETENGEDLEDETFKATKYSKEDAYYYNQIVKGDNSYEITLDRTDDILTWNNSVYLRIKYDTDQEVAYLKSIDIYYRKKLDSQTMLDIDIGKGYHGSEQKEIQDFQFNKETYEISGSFTINYTYYNENELSADIEFKAQPKKVVE
jgi:hypothetical protein